MLLGECMKRREPRGPLRQHGECGKELCVGHTKQSTRLTQEGGRVRVMNDRFIHIHKGGRGQLPKKETSRQFGGFEGGVKGSLEVHRKKGCGGKKTDENKSKRRQVGLKFAMWKGNGGNRNSEVNTQKR